MTGQLPDKSLGRLSQDERREVYGIAAELLARNVGPHLRNTTGARPGAAGALRLWVYGRSGLPCLRGGAGIRFRRMGRQARSTYGCPIC